MEPPSSSGDRPSITPRRPRSNPNISSTPPLKEFAIAFSVVAGLLLVAYWLMGLLVGWAATRLPDSVEARWGQLLATPWSLAADDDWSAAEARLQELVGIMGEALPPRGFEYEVHVVDKPAENAAALPGGHIVVFAGLLREARSENELAMILGHELGHLTHRDHLRALGRRLVLAFLVQAVLGGDTAARALGSGMEIAQQKYSRDQELEADALGLELLVAVYGHAGGATDFFARHVGESTRAMEFLSTHPLSENRIERIEALRRDRGYRVEPTAPWPPPRR